MQALAKLTLNFEAVCETFRVLKVHLVCTAGPRRLQASFSCPSGSFCSAVGSSSAFSCAERPTKPPDQMLRCVHVVVRTPFREEHLVVVHYRQSEPVVPAFPPPLLCYPLPRSHKNGSLTLQQETDFAVFVSAARADPCGNKW